MRRRVLPILVGSVLLATALLKLHSFVAGPFQPQLLLPHRWQHLVLIEIEIALGVWLLGGHALRIAKVAGIAFFGLAAWASIYLGWIGQESCGCFGVVRASPWIALAVDLACLAALFFVRGEPSERFLTVLKSFWVQVVLAACVILGLAVEAFFLTVEDPERVLARWRGDILAVEPTIIDAGPEVAGKQRTVTLRVYNYSNRVVNIVGGTSSCACIAIESLPVRVKPIGTEIQVVINYKGSPGRFLRQFVLYTDHPSARVMYVSFRGEVLKKPSNQTVSKGRQPFRAPSPLTLKGGRHMRRTTVRGLATLCCALGVALVGLGAMLCPQSLYADQGTANFLPCSLGCFGDCETRPISACPTQPFPTTNSGCDAAADCDQGRCVKTGTYPNEYCYCS